jgi:hypothetical protein
MGAILFRQNQLDEDAGHGKIGEGNQRHGEEKDSLDVVKHQIFDYVTHFKKEQLIWER